MLSRRLGCALVLAVGLLGLTGAAHAWDDPDVEIAKKHYESGLGALDAKDYARALAELEAARQARPAPEISYGIARCLDGLGRRAEAAQAYADYLAAQPYAPNAKTLRDRILELDPLRGRGVRKHRYTPSIAVGGTALALAALGGGLLGGAEHEFNGAVKSCGPSCSVAQSAGFLRLSGAAYASFAAAGVAALVDVGLLIRAARQHE
jgi:tetratricopeptide (TPR) repeat protein